jgi:hypothetical protein
VAAAGAGPGRRNRRPLRPGHAQTSLAAEADRALGRLAGASLVTFRLRNSTVAAHRLVTRVIRDHLITTGRLADVCQSAARLLAAVPQALKDIWH